MISSTMTGNVVDIGLFNRNFIIDNGSIIDSIKRQLIGVSMIIIRILMMMTLNRLWTL